MVVNTDDDALVASIDGLLHNFRDSLVALVPMAERAKMIWADVMYQHPLWEKLQMCLFDVLVRGNVTVDRARTEREYPLPPYDIDIDDYSNVSLIECISESGERFTFVRFVTHDQPFDGVQGVKIDMVTQRRCGHVELPLANVGFSYLRRAPDGYADRVYSIEAVE